MDVPQHGELVAAPQQQQEVALQPGVAAAATAHAQPTAATMVLVLHTEVEAMVLALHTEALLLAWALAHQPGLPEVVAEPQQHQHMVAVVEEMHGTLVVERQRQHRKALGAMRQRLATMVLRHPDQMARQLQARILLLRQLLVDRRRVLGVTMRQLRVLPLVLRLRVFGDRRPLRRVLELGVMMVHSTLSKESQVTFV